MRKFEITYYNKDGNLKTEIIETQDSDTITAEECADDYAYSVSHKGWYNIKPLN